MLDMFVLFVMLGLAVMALQLIVVRLLGLRGRNVRAALCQLVRGVKLPTGFREDLLVDRVLADPRIDPLGTGTQPSAAVTHVTRVDGPTFCAALKDAFASASPDRLIEGFAKRPETARLEVRKEIEALAPKAVDHAARHFDGTMAAYADRYKGTMRILSAILGIGAVLATATYFEKAMDKDHLTYVLLALGIVTVPVLAAAWYGLLAEVAKLRPAAEQAALPGTTPSGSSSRPSRRRPQRGKPGGSGRGGSGDASKPDSSDSGGGGGGGGGGGSSRRRGRRSGGRRGGRRGGGGGGGGDSSGS